jgi:hypothetical protein
MIQIILTFSAAFLLSGIAAYYSVIGLAAIFVGAFWPVVFMGSTLEFAKLVTASWLYRNWKTAPILLKTYLTIAVVILMLLTSMGIFGFLAKAHIDSTLDAGVNSVELKTLNQQEKIAKERLDYLLKRAGNPETASAAIDRQIQTTQRELSDINKKRLPLLKEENKLIADVGPIKYVADIFFGDGEGALDKAVRMVIFTIMLVFDPLAVLLLVAGNISLRERYGKQIPLTVSVPEPVEPELKEGETIASPSETIEVQKENLATITEAIPSEPPQEVVTEVQIPGMYTETPVKKLEPKYDYEAEYAFREKENK